MRRGHDAPASREPIEQREARPQSFAAMEKEERRAAAFIVELYLAMPRRNEDRLRVSHGFFRETDVL